jgi:hypothetical protein
MKKQKTAKIHRHRRTFQKNNYTVCLCREWENKILKNRNNVFCKWKKNTSEKKKIIIKVWKKAKK